MIRCKIFLLVENFGIIGIGVFLIYAGWFECFPLSYSLCQPDIKNFIYF